MPKKSIHRCSQCPGRKFIGWGKFLSHITVQHVQQRTNFDVEPDQYQVAQEVPIRATKVESADEVSLGQDSMNQGQQVDMSKDLRLKGLALREKKSKPSKKKSQCILCEHTGNYELRYNHLITHLWAYEHQQSIPKYWSKAIRVLKKLDRYIPVDELLLNYLSPTDMQLQDTPFTLIRHIFLQVKCILPSIQDQLYLLKALDYAIFLACRVIPKIYCVLSNNLYKEVEQHLRWVTTFFDCRHRKEGGYTGVRIKSDISLFTKYIAKFIENKEQYNLKVFKGVWQLISIETQKRRQIERFKNQMGTKQWKTSFFKRKNEKEGSKVDLRAEVLKNIQDSPSYTPQLYEIKADIEKSIRSNMKSLARPLFLYKKGDIYNHIDDDKTYIQRGADYKVEIIDHRTFKPHEQKHSNHQLNPQDIARPNSTVINALLNLI